MREPNARCLLSSLHETEVGPVPIDWSIVRLEEITDPERPISYGIVQTGPRIQNGVPCLRVVDIQDGKIHLDDLITTSEEISNAYKRTKLRDGDLVVPLRGKVGECAQVAKSLTGANLTRGVALVAVLPKYNAAYCRQFFSSSRSRTRLNGSLNGSALQEVPIATLRSFKIAIPPSLDEQVAIADALADADALIDSLEQLLTKKRQIKQGAMQELLTGKRRLPGFAGPWLPMKLGDIATITMGRTPARLIGKYWGSGHKWLSIADLRGKVVSESKEEITAEGAQGMEVVPAGTLLMSFKLTIGRLALAGCDLFTNEAICALRSPTVDKELLYYALSQVDFSLFGKQAVKGYTLNKESLRSVEVLLPTDPDEQQAIARVLSDMDTELTALESRLTKARALKQAMAQALLTGRIRLVPEGAV